MSATEPTGTYQTYTTTADTGTGAWADASSWTSTTTYSFNTSPPEPVCKFKVGDHVTVMVDGNQLECQVICPSQRRGSMEIILTKDYEHYDAGCQVTIDTELLNQGSPVLARDWREW